MRKKFTTTIQEDLLKELKKMAIEEGLDANDIIEQALRVYFKSNVTLKCRKCNSIYSVFALQGKTDFEFALHCPHCGSGGIYAVEELQDNSL